MSRGAILDIFREQPIATVSLLFLNLEPLVFLIVETEQVRSARGPRKARGSVGRMSDVPC